MLNHSNQLCVEARSAAIKAMEERELDVLIVGGGITGTGAALDAASRGLSVGLIEKGDLASGTSSKSSKMIHGGLRYLEQMRLGLVREALFERGVLLKRIAPHLVRPVPFLYPLRHRLWERLYIGAGIFLYDRLGGARQLPAGKHLGRVASANLAPALRKDSYVGGIQFWDAQVDDARYTLFAARTAAALGAQIATRIRADGFIVENGRAKGVHTTDLESGATAILRARHIISAAGPWTGKLLKDNGNLPFRVRPSKGIHIVLPKSAINMDTALLARTETGLLFVIPWEGQWLVGDTDIDWPYDPDDVAPTSADVAELLKRLNSQIFKEITPGQILSVFAGLRPLAADGNQADSREVSRTHTIATPMPGLTVICGGKFTTYRKMAVDLIDIVANDVSGRTPQRSSTHKIVLVGGAGFSDRKARRENIAAEMGWPVERVDRLLHKYGSCIDDLVTLVRARPDLGVPLTGVQDTLRGEIVYACSHEGALHLADVMERRTRFAMLEPMGGAAALREIATLMQEELGWTDEQAEVEIASYASLTSVADEIC